MNKEEILNRTTDTNHVYFGTKKKVLDLMIDGEFRSLLDIYELIDVNPTTVSAILRTFRTEKYGSMMINKKRDPKSGEWIYQLISNNEPRAK